LLGVFTWKLGASEAQVYAFGESTITYLTKLVCPCHAANGTVGACALLHSGAFLAGYAADTNPHAFFASFVCLESSIHLLIKGFNYVVSFRPSSAAQASTLAISIVKVLFA